MLISEWVINYNKDLTSRLINIIDSEINNNNDLINSMSADDRETYLDDFLEHTEYLIGLGFVVLQQYMTVIYGNLKKEKSCALQKGPRHKSGRTFAEIVDYSANYWKHHNEWLSGEQKSYCFEKRSNKFFKIVLSTNSSHDMYWRLRSTLCEISNNGRLNDVLCVIQKWKTCLAPKRGEPVQDR